MVKSITYMDVGLCACNTVTPRWGKQWSGIFFPSLPPLSTY